MSCKPKRTAAVEVLAEVCICWHFLLAGQCGRHVLHVKKNSSSNSTHVKNNNSKNSTRVKNILFDEGVIGRVAASGGLGAGHLTGWLMTIQMNFSFSPCFSLQSQ